MPNLRGSEWLIIILLVVLLFGAKRLPDAARSVGRSLRIFKAETKGLVDDSAAPQDPSAATPPTSATPTVGTAPAAPQIAGGHPGTASADPGPVLQPQPEQAPGALQPQPPTQ